MAQQVALLSQIKSLKADLADQRVLLDQGLIQAPRVSAIERELAELEGSIGALASERAQAEGRITEIKIEIDSLINQQSEAAEIDLRDTIARNRDLLEHQSILQTRIDQLAIRAPVSGAVFGLKVTTLKTVVPAGGTLMVIVPRDQPLYVAARVAAMHVDEVHLGQDVRLVFSSLPTRTTPQLIGTVTQVSADALTDDRTGIGFYKVDIAIDPDALARLKDVRLVPGMPVTAYFRTADRSPLSFLLKPFTDYFRNAMRET